jgi:N-acetyl-beta-hexosaminidase
LIVQCCLLAAGRSVLWRNTVSNAEADVTGKHSLPTRGASAETGQIDHHINNQHSGLVKGERHGWRIEIKSLPKLTEVGAWRVPRTGTFGTNEAPQPGEAATYGGFYTQEEIKEVYSMQKTVSLKSFQKWIYPGHSMAAIAAYPELCVTKDASVKVNPGSDFSKWFGNGKFEMYIDNTLNPTDEKVYQFLDKVFTEVAMLFPL